MKNKEFLLVLLLFLGFLVLVVLQRNTIHIIGKELEKKNTFISCAENYIWTSFCEENITTKSNLCSLLTDRLEEYDIAIFVPQSICRACFSSLLFQLQDNNIDFTRIIVIGTVNDTEIKSECFSRGMQFIIGDNLKSSSAQILVARKYQDFLPIVMSYAIEDAPLLNLFLSDDESMINRHTISSR